MEGYLFGNEVNVIMAQGGFATASCHRPGDGTYMFLGGRFPAIGPCSVPLRLPGHPSVRCAMVGRSALAGGSNCANADPFVCSSSQAPSGDSRSSELDETNAP
jgi:hypothetical protein